MLRAAFAPQRLEVLDESASHAGHAGARDGAGHFAVTIVSERFRGQSAVARHRMIYAALDEMMPREVHALRITAFASDE